MQIDNPMYPLASILFDESHCESWSICKANAIKMNPDNPSNSSYFKAASYLESEGFCLDRLTNPIQLQDKLKTSDIFVILHPCHTMWENTTNIGKPSFTLEEISLIKDFVFSGGSLLIITEYEYEKYGTNLNEILKETGILILNTTVKNSSECNNNNSTWVFSHYDPLNLNGVTQLVDKACFYRTGSCQVEPRKAIIIAKTSSQANMAEGLIAQSCFGEGNIIVVCDSDIFGDEFFDEFNHKQLWKNIIFLLARSAISKHKLDYLKPSLQSLWDELKSSIERLRELQNNDGSVNSNYHDKAKLLVIDIKTIFQETEAVFPQNKEYISSLISDFSKWEQDGFQKPDFSSSISNWNPQNRRADNIHHLIVFPMYLPNASTEIKFDALLIKTAWPDWIASLEMTIYNNNAYLPGILLDYTSGYDSECAVLFPEMVSVNNPVPNNFGIIFCDREAKRFSSYVRAVSSLLMFPQPPDFSAFLSSEKLVTCSFMLWDLVHDRFHTKGHLPFDPFMVKQKQPYWMYALEELRVDLTTYTEMCTLKDGFPFANYVLYSILFDRLFRFPISGTREKNYDGLAGQILFGFLYNSRILKWRDKQFSIDWKELHKGIEDLARQMEELYENNVNNNKVTSWVESYKFICQFVKPDILTKCHLYINGKYTVEFDENMKFIHLVSKDEFPLNLFYSNLLLQMSC